MVCHAIILLYFLFYLVFLVSNYSSFSSNTSFVFLYLVSLILHLLQFILFLYLGTRWTSYFGLETALPMLENLGSESLSTEEIIGVINGEVSLSFFHNFYMLYIGLVLTLTLLGFGFFVYLGVGEQAEAQNVNLAPHLGIENIVLFETPSIYVSSNYPLILTWMPENSLELILYGRPVSVEYPLVLTIPSNPIQVSVFALGSVEILPFMYNTSPFVSWTLPNVDSYLTNSLVEMANNYNVHLRINISCPIYSEFQYTYLRYVASLNDQVWSGLFNNQLVPEFGYLNSLDLESQEEESFTILTSLNTEEISMVSTVYPSISYEHRLFSESNPLNSLAKISAHYSGHTLLELESLNIYLQAPYRLSDPYTLAMSNHISYIINHTGRPLSGSESAFLSHSFINILEDINMNYPISPYYGVVQKFGTYEQFMQIYGNDLDY